MAFVKLKNLKGETIRIPGSAAKSYENLGFFPEEQFEDAVEETTTDMDEDGEDEGQEERESEEDSKGTGTEDEDANFVNEIQKKPLASWNKEEVKRYASILEIDLSGTKNVNEAKERIKAYMNDAE